MIRVWNSLKRISVKFIVLLLCMGLSALSLSAQQTYRTYVKGSYTVNGTTYSLDGLIVESYNPQLGFYELSGNLIHKPPIAIVHPQKPIIMKLTGIIGETVIFASMGEGGTAVVDFGAYGILTDNFEVTGEKPLTFTHNFSGTLNGLPEVTFPMVEENMTFTWDNDGQAVGTVTINSAKPDGSLFTLPVSYTITYRANPPIDLPATFTGWAEITSYNPYTGEVVGKSSY
jgi:hypothetical protein